MGGLNKMIEADYNKTRGEEMNHLEETVAKFKNRVCWFPIRTQAGFSLWCGA